MASQLQRFAEMTGFKVHENIAYGRLSGIFFNIAYASMSIACTVSAHVKREAGVDLIETKAFLAENKKKYKAAEPVSDGQSITITLQSSTVLKAEKAAEFIQEFSQFLSANGYRSECAFCSGNENLGYTVQDGRVMEACPACHEKFENIVTELKEEREQTGSYLRGAIGAVVGGIIGIIPWALIGLLGYIAAISGAIMAFLTYKGYLLFKGKRGRGMLFIVIAVLIVFTYAAVIVNQTITDYQYLTGLGYYDIPVFELFGMELAAPFYPEDAGYLWAQIGLGWLFAGLGSFLYLRNIRKESLGKDIEVTRLPDDTNK
jgi:hypothetical protein